MRTGGIALFITAILLLSGCATVEPISFEQSLQTSLATRNDVRDWDEELRYRVELQYANTARQKLETVDLDVPPNTNIDFQVPFAIWDYARGDNFEGAMAFADWFNSGLSKESRYGYYFNRTLGNMVNPNTHYFTFDERPGIATEQDVNDAWDEAYRLFQAVYNSTNQCYVFGYTEEFQYAKTYPKNVAGKYKDVLFLCKHPVLEGQQQKVTVTAYANPFDGVRVIAGAVSQCYVAPPRGQKFVDVRGCGARLAERQRGQLTESRFGWTELVTTPIEETPYLFEVQVRNGDSTTVLPAPETQPKYQEYLRSIKYIGNTEARH